jgi:hypothetical protein
MSQYNQNITKTATSLKYFNEILGIPIDLANVIADYFKQEIGGDKTKSGYYMGKIRKNLPVILENAEQLKANPLYLERLFPFVGKSQAKHKYHEQIQYITSVNRKYAPWVTALIDSNQIQEEDFIKVKNLLDRHAELVRSGIITGEETSISFFGNDSDLFNFLKKFQVDTKSFEELMADPKVQAGSKLIVEENTEDYLITVLEVTTYEAMKALVSKDSAWCVAHDEGTFKSYNPPLYHMFFINGEPEVLIHKGSDQVKAQDDSTSFDPLVINAINGIVERLDLNTGAGDFEDYNKVISQFRAYEDYPASYIEEQVEADPSNIIYVSPDKYSLYMPVFSKNLNKVSEDDVVKFPRSFFNFIGQYFKINNMDSHFRFMENLIVSYLNFFEIESDYFKKIPDIFHTKYVYEDGYLSVIIKQLKFYGNIESIMRIMGKLNPKETQREDVSNAFVYGLTNNDSDVQLHLQSLLQLEKLYEDLDAIETYGKKEDIENGIIESIAKEIKKRPRTYSDIESEKILMSPRPELFEAVKYAIRSEPDIYFDVPSSIQNNFRYSAINGYMNLAKKVVAGEEPYSKLSKAPEFVIRQPKYMKILKNFQPDKSLDLNYKLEKARSMQDRTNPSLDFLSSEDPRGELINLMSDISTEELLDPKNFQSI